MMGKTNYLALVGGGKSPKFATNKVGHGQPSFQSLTTSSTLRTFAPR